MANLHKAQKDTLYYRMRVSKVKMGNTELLDMEEKAKVDFEEQAIVLARFLTDGLPGTTVGYFARKMGIDSSVFWDKLYHLLGEENPNSKRGR